MPDDPEVSTPEALTTLLGEVHDGRPGAMDALMERVYDDLRRIARRRLAGAHDGDPLQPTVLVHETYLKLVRQRARFDNRGHFFAVATRMMMQALVDHRRAGAAAKRFGGQVQVTLTGLSAEEAGAPGPSADALDLARGLERLEADDARAAEVVKLRLLWGLTMAEIAESLGVSESTVRRELRFGERWLRAAIGGAV